jgi:hypothetical protein
MAGLRAEPAGLELRAKVERERLSVYGGGQLFTAYEFGARNKYPHFYPVNGPRSGRSVTTRQTEPYPHHSSLFFGCDRVDGGNYWQEGLERGQIVHRRLRVIRARGASVAFEERCSWERPGAASPFADVRRVTIRAPSPDRRIIDFQITLTAKRDVRIEKSNHALFAARMAPDLATTGGGLLISARGDRNEAGTFGQPAPWADYRGARGKVTEGLAILCHPEDPWFPPRWFTRDYGFFSPTPMFWLENDRLDLARGQALRLRYRVVIHADQPDAAELNALHRAWGGEAP